MLVFIKEHGLRLHSNGKYLGFITENSVIAFCNKFPISSIVILSIEYGAKSQLSMLTFLLKEELRNAATTS